VSIRIIRGRFNGPQPTANGQLPIANCQLPTVNNQQLTGNGQLPITHYSLLCSPSSPLRALRLYSVLSVFLLLLLLIGCRPGPAEPGGAAEANFWRQNWSADGREIYRQNCATCHGMHGYGYEGIFPPLRDNPVVTGPPALPMMPIMFGRGAMPGFSSLLSDEEIALVLSFIRNEWGNRAQAVSPSDIAPLRSDGIDAPLDPFGG
jgi:cytochrome c6